MNHTVKEARKGRNISHLVGQESRSREAKKQTTPREVFFRLWKDLKRSRFKATSDKLHKGGTPRPSLRELGRIPEGGWGESESHHLGKQIGFEKKVQGGKEERVKR